MTAVQMIEEVRVKTNGTGRGTVNMDGLIINVKVLDGRKVFGRVDVLITPVSGTGEKWIDITRLEP